MNRGVLPRRVSSASPPESLQSPVKDHHWQERHQRVSHSDPNGRVHPEMGGSRAWVGGSTTPVRADLQAGGIVPYAMGPPCQVWDEEMRTDGMSAPAEFRASSYGHPLPSGNHANVPQQSQSYDHSRMDGRCRTRSPSSNQPTGMFRPQRPNTDSMHGKEEPAFNAGYSSQLSWHANYEPSDWYNRSPRQEDNQQQQCSFHQ